MAVQSLVTEPWLWPSHPSEGTRTYCKMNGAKVQEIDNEIELSGGWMTVPTTYLVGLDVSSEIDFESLSRVYHLPTVPPKGVPVQYSSWKW